MRKRCVEPRDRFQLIYSASRMTQPPPAHLRDFHSARRDDGHYRQSRLVSHAARAVLIRFFARNKAQIHNIAGASHLKRQRLSLSFRHSLKAYSHEQSRRLIIRYASVRNAFNYKADFFIRQLHSVFLLIYYIVCVHNPAILCQ